MFAINAYNGRAVQYIGERTYRAFSVGDYIGIENENGTKDVFQVHEVSRIESRFGAGRHYIVKFSGNFDCGNHTYLWPADKVSLYRAI